MRRTALAIIAAALVGAVLALPAAADDVQVAVQDNEFVPKSVEISVGDTVVWSHQGSRPHTVTADDGSWDSNPDCPSNIASCMVAGQSYERQFDQAGTFPYYCKLHGSAGGGGMAGVVVVKAAQTSPPPPPPTTAPPATDPPATTAPPATQAPTTTAEATSEEPTTTVAAADEPAGDEPAVLESESDSGDGENDTTSTTFELAAEADEGGDGGAPVGLIAGGIVLVLAAGGLAGWRYWPRAG